jgi:hypothetical protein
VPSEFHRIASKRQHPTFGISLCLNCHAVLTYRQLHDWHASWKTEQHVERSVAQGIADVFVLWLQRSHAGWALGELAKLCAQAAWVLIESWGLVGWEGWQAA